MRNDRKQKCIKYLFIHSSIQSVLVLNVGVNKYVFISFTCLLFQSYKYNIERERERYKFKSNWTSISCPFFYWSILLHLWTWFHTIYDKNYKCCFLITIPNLPIFKKNFLLVSAKTQLECLAFLSHSPACVPPTEAVRLVGRVVCACVCCELLYQCPSFSRLMISVKPQGTIECSVRLQWVLILDTVSVLYVLAYVFN